MKGKGRPTEGKPNSGCVEVNHSTRQHQGMDAAPQHSACLLPWRPTLRVTTGKQRLYFVCVYMWGYVDYMCVCHTMRTTARADIESSVCVCVRTHVLKYIHASVLAHLCCGRGCRCWNLRSRWRSAPREDCSSPSHHRNTITMATKVGMKESWEREYEKERETLLCYFKLSTIFKSKSLWYHNTPTNTKHIINRWL